MDTEDLSKRDGITFEITIPAIEFISILEGLKTFVVNNNRSWIEGDYLLITEQDSNRQLHVKIKYREPIITDKVLSEIYAIEVLEGENI